MQTLTVNDIEAAHTARILVIQDLLEQERAAALTRYVESVRTMWRKAGNWHGADKQFRCYWRAGILRRYRADVEHAERIADSAHLRANDHRSLMLVLIHSQRLYGEVTPTLARVTAYVPR